MTIEVDNSELKLSDISYAEQVKLRCAIVREVTHIADASCLDVMAERANLTHEFTKPIVDHCLSPEKLNKRMVYLEQHGYPRLPEYLSHKDTAWGILRVLLENQIVCRAMESSPLIKGVANFAYKPKPDEKLESSTLELLQVNSVATTTCLAICFGALVFMENKKVVYPDRPPMSLKGIDPAMKSLSDKAKYEPKT